MIEEVKGLPRLLAIAVGVSVLLGTGYHFGVTVPAQERREAQEQAVEAAEKQARRETRNMNAYQQCVQQVEFQSSQGWNRHCEVLSAQNLDNRKNCYMMGYNKGYCNITFPDVPPSNCLLPSSIADKYDAQMERNKIKCQSHLHDN